MIQRGCRRRKASGLDMLGDDEDEGSPGCIRVVGGGAPGLRWRSDMAATLALDVYAAQERKGVLGGETFGRLRDRRPPWG